MPVEMSVQIFLDEEILIIEVSVSNLKAVEDGSLT